MTHHVPTGQLARAAKALQGYEHAAFPGKPTLLGRDQLYASALMAALICDLEHYAGRYGISFSSVINTGRSVHADEAAEQSFYGIGDHVRLPHHGNRCGTIIGWITTDTANDRTFLVAVPGVPNVYDEPAARLAPAPPFPATSTKLGIVTRALQAESAYIDLALRIPGTPLPAQGVLRQDCQRLLAALSTWSGVPAPELLKGLNPKITNAAHPPNTALPRPPHGEDHTEPF
ncbi:hypothetical protein BJF79_08770 [Actinomadura sp. CNU-125]|uniref:hypothetical protein n=1 Tax=Actinomadura sp. CNU-125 TaxID=1904961 RepID=UPI00095CE618|nr:hypothetical protein [Actinomadura sp. CNU-125]OLT31877.1 hypothetical protein BJF79_08770 [Actinomadura sp. CNU-125]